MRFRLGLVTGLAAGYYLGTRAGRQRYDQINRQLTKLKNSEAFDEAAERAKAVVSEGVGKAKSLVDRGGESGGGTTGAPGAGPSNGSGAAPIPSDEPLISSDPIASSDPIVPGDPLFSGDPIVTADFLVAGDTAADPPTEIIVVEGGTAAGTDAP